MSAAPALRRTWRPPPPNPPPPRVPPPAAMSTSGARETKRKTKKGAGGYPARYVKAEREVEARGVRAKEREVQNSLEWSLDEVKEILQDKCLGRVRRAQVTIKTAYEMFGAPRGPFTKERLKSVCRGKLGVNLSDKDAERVFEDTVARVKPNADGSGHVGFTEFISGFLPQDYPTKPWFTRRGEENARTAARQRVELHLPFEKDVPRSIKKHRWSINKLEKIIQDKLLGRCRRPEDQYKRYYKLFGCPQNGIAWPLFHQTVVKTLGVAFSEEESKALFGRYDRNKDGSLDFKEFICNVFPPDYDNKRLWYQQRSKQNQDEANARRLGVSTKGFRRVASSSASRRARIPPIKAKTFTLTAPYGSRIH